MTVTSTNRRKREGRGGTADASSSIVSSASSCDDSVIPNAKRIVKHKRRYCRHHGCDKIVKSQGLCQRHGAIPKTCRVSGCSKQAQGSYNGMCKLHYRSSATTPATTCIVIQRDDHSRVPVVPVRPMTDTATYTTISTTGNSSSTTTSTMCDNRDDDDNGMACYHPSTPTTTPTYNAASSKPSMISRRDISTDTQFSFDVASILEDDDIDYVHTFDCYSNYVAAPDVISSSAEWLASSSCGAASYYGTSSASAFSTNHNDTMMTTTTTPNNSLSVTKV